VYPQRRIGVEGEHRIVNLPDLDSQHALIQSAIPWTSIWCCRLMRAARATYEELI